MTRKLIAVFLSLVFAFGNFSLITFAGDEQQNDINPTPCVADVRTVNGIPRLVVNGEITSGNLFFINGDIPSSNSIYSSEINYASENNVHLFSTNYNINYSADISLPAAYRYGDLKKMITPITDTDPYGKILLRVSLIASAEQIGDDAVEDGAQTGWVSMASDKWADETTARLNDLIKYIESEPELNSSVYGFHLDCGEWFPRNFNQNVDTSECNSKKFRSWLNEQYKTDEALQTAWRDGSVTLASAKVPADMPINAEPSRTLLLDDTDRKFVDYNLYFSDLTADRINTFAKAIKEACGNRKIVVSFYGYYFEQFHAATGHWDFQTLLNSPYLDGFASPVTYIDRNSGSQPITATSGYMTAADSVIRAGKLWISESDERTFINRTESSPDILSYPPLRSIDEINKIHKREMGIAAVHGTTMYPMDLLGYGWYDDEKIWTNYGRLNAAYSAYLNGQKEQNSFDVAIVVDEESSSVVGSTYNLSSDSLAQTMLAVYRSGVSFGLFEMDNVMNGRADDCKVYIFTNPYALKDSEVARLSEALHKDNKTAVYMYGFGNLSADNIRDLTGMEVSVSKSTESHSLKLVKNTPFSKLGSTLSGCTGNCRVVCNNYSTLFGTYDDGAAGFAAYNGQNYTTVFYGSNRISSEMIRELARMSGVNVFSETKDVLTANQNMVVLSVQTGGTKTVSFAEKVDVYDYFNDKWYENTDSVSVKRLTKGDVVWLFYGDKNEIDSWDLPEWEEVKLSKIEMIWQKISTWICSLMARIRSLFI